MSKLSLSQRDRIQAGIQFIRENLTETLAVAAHLFASSKEGVSKLAHSIQTAIKRAKLRPKHTRLRVNYRGQNKVFNIH